MSDTILKQIRDAIIDGEIDQIGDMVEKALHEKTDVDVIMETMTDAIRFIGSEFEAHRLFLPEMILAAESMKAALEVIRPRLESSNREYLGRVVIGTVAGDTHDIGKNIVISSLIGSGFEVHDLGVDVAADDFVKAIREIDPHLVGASAYMATTAPAIGEVEKTMRDAQVRERVKFIIGGAAISEGHVAFYHADAYGKNAPDAVLKARALIEAKKGARL